MRTTQGLKFRLWFSVCLIVSGAAFGQPPTVALNDAERLHKLFDDDWKRAMTEFPEFATVVGYPGQNDRWTDSSIEAIERRKQWDKQSLNILGSVGRSKLSPADELNYDLYHRLLREHIEGHRFPSEYMPITHLDGVQQDVARVIAIMPAFTVKDYENIVARLNGVPKLIDQTILLLNKGLERSVTPPRITLRDVPEQVKNQLVDEPMKSPLLVPFTKFPDSVPLAERSRLTKEAIVALTEKVIPAYRKLYDYLVQKYLPAARETIALGDLPDGQAWYDYAVRVSTTTNLSPRQIHELGLSEVKRIRAEMDKVIASTGFKGSFDEFKQFLQTDARFFFTDAESCLVAYRDITKRADPELVKLFGKLPRLPYGVVSVPGYMAKSQTGAYYEGGSLDAGRPGNFFVNTYDLKTQQKWQMEALTLHEAVPGHHLQVALAQELSEMPEFRKHLGNTAYVEGWGLYAESLGYEMGFYTDPYAKFGQLNYEMWRAVRLVLDTGIHTIGWNRQQAIDYFKQNTAISEHEIIVEVDRYIVWPGQALGYKLGQLKIKELRGYAGAELGSAFNVRAFHDQVLGNGALPLEVLEERIKAWVDERKTKKRAAS